MNYVGDLFQFLEQKRQAGNIGAHINGSGIRIYESSPLQFNATLPGCRYPTIKGEVRSPGRLTVAVAPKEGESIDFTQAKVFTMNEPLERIAAAFPQSTDMRQFVNCLVDSN